MRRDSVLRRSVFGRTAAADMGEIAQTARRRTNPRVFAGVYRGTRDSTVTSRIPCGRTDASRPIRRVLPRRSCPVNRFRVGKRKPDYSVSNPVLQVGLAGFEPAASSSRTKRATKLRYSPFWQRPLSYSNCRTMPNRCVVIVLCHSSTAGCSSEMGLFPGNGRNSAMSGCQLDGMNSTDS